MKKLLALLALLTMTATQSAWAEELTGETFFSLTTTGSLGTATEEENTYSKNGTTVYDKNEVKNKITAGETDSDPWTFLGTASYVKVELENALRVGDVVTINAKNTSKGGVFRICDDIANNSSAGIVGHGSVITVSTTLADCSVTLDEDNALVGKTVFYLGWSSSNYAGTLVAIKVYDGSPTTSAITANKTWSFTGYDAPTSATGAPIVNDNMLYGAGIKMETKDDFSEYSGYLLNLNGNHSAGFDAANGKYLMFKLPANKSGYIVIKHIPYGSAGTNKTLACKIGDDVNPITAAGKTLLTSEAITFSTTAETPVYIYVSSSHSTYYLHSVQVTFAPTITVSSVAQYATYCYPVALDFSETGAKIYTAKASGTNVSLTEISDGIVPANTGVMIYKSGGGAVAPEVTTTEATYTDNELVGITSAQTVAYGEGPYNYIMEWDNTNRRVVFNRAVVGGAILAANKAYLSTSVNTKQNSLQLTFSEATGIENVNVNLNLNYNARVKVIRNGRLVIEGTNGMYNAAGQQVK